MHWEDIKKVIKKVGVSREELYNAQDKLAEELEVVIRGDDTELQREMAKIGEQLRLRAQQMAPVDTGHLQRRMVASLKGGKLEISGNYDPSEVEVTAHGDAERKFVPIEETAKRMTKFTFKKGISNEQ